MLIHSFWMLAKNVSFSFAYVMCGGNKLATSPPEGILRYGNPFPHGIFIFKLLWPQLSPHIAAAAARSQVSLG